MTSPRLVTRGESSPEGESLSSTVGLDWLNFTVRLDSAPGDVLTLVDELAGLHPGVITFEAAKGLHGYERGVFDEGTQARVCWGGESQGGTAWVSLPGAFFAVLDADGLLWLRYLCETWHARITRVDLACDWHRGEFSIDDAVNWYRSGRFTTGGRPPSCSTVGDWITGGGAGRTLYVGKAKNGKLIRAYEKGRQLGDAESPWVRFEVQLTAQDREIPQDVLADPAAYFQSAARWPFVVSSEPVRIRTSRVQEKVAFDKLLSHGRQAYGPLVTYMSLQGFSDAAIVRALGFAGRLPRRLFGLTEETRREECNALIRRLLAEEGEPCTV